MSRSPEDLIRQACRLEVLARKPGNVHPEASFSDVTCADFLRSADLASGWLARAGEIGVGASIERAIDLTRSEVATNTNLGIVLLIAPLAAVPSELTLRAGIEGVLERLTVQDAAHVYRAIRRAAPGGLGSAGAEDVLGEPTQSLRDVMTLAADYDQIARQYAVAYSDVLDFGLPMFTAWWERTAGDWERAVIGLQLEWLARWPDTLIIRKCGAAIGEAASRRAQEVLNADWPTGSRAGAALEQFDRWLREDGHQRNPGTTADLVAAVLYSALRETELPLPVL